MASGTLPLRQCLALLACLGGILYCCVLPLWEGFDEPFHYAYVESLLQCGKIPVLNRTHISREIERSLRMVPLSRLLSAAVPGAKSFEESARMTEEERRARSGALESLTAAEKREPSQILNYEAQQAPLAYLCFVPLDYVFGALPLRSRVVVLRIIATVCAALAMFWGSVRISNLMGLQGALQSAALFFGLQVQMLWASVAHVGNDVLAIPLTLWFLVWLARARREPTLKNLLWCPAVLCAGLLTKAYFVSLVPILLLLLAWLTIRRMAPFRHIAASAAVLLLSFPWYLRNLHLYGTMTGTQQAVKGIGPVQALTALPHIAWATSLLEYARRSLWTGNWSFTSFSRITLNLELLLLTLGLAAYLFAYRQAQSAERWLLGAFALFGCGLVYQTCVTWVESNGQALYPEPWYAQGVFAVLIVFCYRGFQLRRDWGHVAAIALTVLSGWIALMTYLAKLLPYYGNGITRSNVRVLWAWWTAHPRIDLMGVVASPVQVVWVLLILYSLALLSASVVVCIRLGQELPSRTTLRS